MADGVVITPRVFKDGNLASVALDTNFLGTHWARKVYTLRGKTKWPETAHAHDAEEIVIPHAVSGQAVLACRHDGRTNFVTLEVGKAYRVESMVAHQFSGDGEMMIEVWSPTRSLVSPGTIVRTQDDFFPEASDERQASAPEK